jgi:hypothetical protein
MNKLTALSKLANAYHTLQSSAPRSTHGSGPGDSEALAVLRNAFGYVRRSLTISDLRPRTNAEGFNGKMPSYF